MLANLLVPSTNEPTARIERAKMKIQGNLFHTGGVLHGHRQASQTVHSGPSPQRSSGPAGAPAWRTITPGFPFGNPAEIPQEGVRAGEITGFRSWLLVYGESGVFRHNLTTRTYTEIKTHPTDMPEFYLVSVSRGIAWENARMTGDASRYGVFAFRDLAKAHDEAHEHTYLLATTRGSGAPLDVLTELEFDNEPYLQRARVLGFVLGEVELWGEVVEHEYGYRAEFAEITAFRKMFMLPSYAHGKNIYGPGLAPVLSKHYGVPFK